MSIATNLSAINATLQTNHAQLIAISKTQSNENILAAYQAGQRVFGENKAQELAEKQQLLPLDIKWHMVGHLQTNKVKYIAPFVELIHSVDSLHLLEEINKQALKNNRVIDCLLQLSIADEETKYGLDLDEAITLLRDPDYQTLKNIRLVGVMGMATNTDNLDQIKEEFYELKIFFQGLKQSFFRKEDSFKEISMGMSHDYQIALEEGSTMVRIGSAIFGKRQVADEQTYSEELDA